MLFTLNRGTSVGICWAGSRPHRHRQYPCVSWVDLLAIVGFLWYPIKRLIIKRKQSAPVGIVPREQHAEKGDNTPVEPAQK